MQARYPDGLNDIEPYDSKKLEEHLEAGATEVRVFRLKKGMIVNIEGELYKVTAVRENGKVTMRPK
jgi:hypothetical protein